MLATIGNGSNDRRLPGSRESRAALLEEISELKRARNAVILAHYYQDPAIQDLADHLGDSLALARKAQQTRADVIVFCGVHFMAETAKILNPTRTVVLPDLAAGCSLADSCPADEFEQFIAANPGHVVISYVNTTAAVKALSDIICTSSNARTIIDSIPADQPIIFGPDKHLGRYLVNQTGREMKLWQGTCMVHVRFSERKIGELKLRHPEAEMLAHPECEDQVLALADFIGSTTEIINRSAASQASTFIVATEAGVIHQMQQLSPGKTFLRAPGEGSADGACEACDECPHMRLNTVEKVRDCLRDLSPQIELAETLRTAAHRPIERMLALS